KPGSLQDSVLYQRIAAVGSRHMPPLATSILNDEAISLLALWITNDLPRQVSFSDWQANYFPDSAAPAAQPLADPHADGNSNYFEYLTGTDPNNPADAWRLKISSGSGQVFIEYRVPANLRLDLLASTDLSNPYAWQPVAAPAAQPFYWSADHDLIVPLPNSAITTFYRVRMSRRGSDA